MITQYGYDVFFTITAVCIFVALGAFFFIEQHILRVILISLASILFIFTLNFFRDPERVTPADDKLIISPADGTVIKIEKVDETEFMKSPSVMVSIFMSPINVHVNRIPITGIVKYFQYVKGEYFAAFEDKASLKNEQTHIGIESPKGRVFFKQIAGFIARRIIANVNVEDSVEAGKRFGMIKFGSRVDIYVPENAAIKVSLNEKTSAGETIIAEFK
ncbi:MAG: phosphatidylserine decarboxylase family protein [Bacteroidetes bacterium]|nr:phosphatidylserine decarboxylase family protein [Bacteroidota bacterium]